MWAAPVSTDILETIDGALLDFDLSTDAMRWCPEGKRVPVPRGTPAAVTPLDGATWTAPAPVTVDVFVDTAQFTRLLNEFIETLSRAVRPVLDDAARGLHALSAALFPGQHRRCLTCRPSRKPKPLAVDGHEYQRRLRARRRRKR